MEFFKHPPHHPLHAPRAGVQRHLAASRSCSRCSSSRTKGLHFSIEFTGGTVMEVSYKHDGQRRRRSATTLDGIGLTDVAVQNFGTSRDVLIRLPLKTVEGSSQNVEMQKQADAVMAALKARGPSRRAEARRVRRPPGRQGARRPTARWRSSSSASAS